MEKEFGDQNFKESHQFGNLRSADGDVASRSLISLTQPVFSKSAVGRRIRRQLFDLRRLLSLR